MRRLAIAGAALVAISASLGFQAPALASGLAGSGLRAAQTRPFLPSQLSVLSDPNVAFGLLLLAMLGLGLELVHPGTLFPGIVGLTAGGLVVVGLIGARVDLIGLLVIGIAVGLFVVDLVAASHGALTVAGVAVAIAGGVLMFWGRPISPIAVVGLPLGLGAVWAVLSRRALEVRHRPYPKQPQELLGQTGIVMNGGNGVGLASVAGELWRVVSRDAALIPEGSEVEVMAQDGLTLIVRVTDLPDEPGIKTVSARTDLPQLGRQKGVSS